MARMRLGNPDTGLSVEVAYRKKELPCFTQWKMMGEREYVMGLEPANCYPEGQKSQWEQGMLKTLSPGQSVEFRVEITATDSRV